MQNHGTMSWWYLIVGSAGGLALFLFGIEQLSNGLKKSAGNRLRSILSALSRNRMVALLVGALVTMVIQSSSATTVMLVSFVQAELLSFSQSLGVILGADIGTTITAQLIAFKLTDQALLLTAVGIGLRMIAKRESLKHFGEILFGFGILFYGMKLMSDAMTPLREYAGFIEVMKRLEHPLLGLLAGTVFTALIQSSAAAIGVFIVLAQQHLITLEAGIALIFGANIGTCITAGLASLGARREAKRVALAHVMFKLTGVLLFILWIPAFADLIRDITSRSGPAPAREIANAHTVFNVSLAFVFLPFTHLFARLTGRILPDRPQEVGIKPSTWYLDDSSISSPALAIDLARAEIARMAKLVLRMLRAIIIPFVSDERMIRKNNISPEEARLLIKEIPTRDEYFPQLTLLEGIDMREKKIDYLDEKINEYLWRLARQELSSQQVAEVYAMVSISNDMESIGDIIHRNMVPLIAKKKELEVDFSEEGKEELLIYHQKACKQISRLMEAFAESNLDKARKIMSKEKKYLDLEEQYRLKHLERIKHDRKESAETHEIHTELMDKMKQIIVYSSNIAKTFLFKSGQKDGIMEQADSIK